MTIDPTIKSQLKQTCYYAAPSARGTSGAPDLTYGSATSFSARCEYSPGTIKTGNGEEKSYSVTLLTETAIGYRDRVWLPGDSSSDATLALHPVSVDRAINEAGGTDYYVVRL